MLKTLLLRQHAYGPTKAQHKSKKGLRKVKGGEGAGRTEEGAQPEEESVDDFAQFASAEDAAGQSGLEWYEAWDDDGYQYWCEAGPTTRSAARLTTHGVPTRTHAQVERGRREHVRQPIRILRWYLSAPYELQEVRT